MKKIIVTGATSMIGTAVIREYVRNDVEKIYAVVRPNSKNINRIPQNNNIEIIESETSDYLSLSEKINDKCDAFYHFAWDGTGALRERSTVGQAKNIVYTLEALAAAKSLECKCFIGAGSQAEYGLLNDPRINENSITKPINPYGIAKLAAGQLVIAESIKIGINCFWVRIFSVYGLYDKSTSMISQAVQKMKVGARMSFTSGVQQWDYLHCDDAARAFYLIAEKSIGQKIYCLGSGQSHPLKDFIYKIRDIVNPEAELGIGDIPYTGNEVMNLCADITKLKQDTSWVPQISFEDGIKALVNKE